jgi:hypothetical protein
MLELNIQDFDSYIQIEYQTTLEHFYIKKGKITKTKRELQDFYQWIRSEFPFYLLPLKYSSDLVKLGLMVGDDYLYDKVICSDSFRQFLESTFHPPELTTQKESSSFKLFFTKRKEIDLFYELFEKELTEFQMLMSGIGKSNDILCTKEADTAKLMQQLHKEYPIPEPKLARSRLYYMVEFRKQLKLKLVELLQFSDIVKQALEYRYRLLSNYELCCQNTQKKVLKMSSLQNSKNIATEKVDVLLEEMAVCKREEQEKKDLLKYVGQVLKREIDQYQKDRNLGFEELIQEYVDLQIKLLS